NVGVTAAASTVNLTPPPDLEVTSISVPGTALAGHAFALSYTVTNAGAGATPNFNWNDALYLSPTATFDSGTAIPLGWQNHQGSLAAGDAYTRSVTVTVPSGMTGSYYIVVKADVANVVYELDDTNNQAVSGNAVLVSQAPADLVVASTVAPSEAVPGS